MNARMTYAAALLSLIGLGGCVRAGNDARSVEPGTVAAETAVSRTVDDLDFAHLTEGWSNTALQECGPQLMEALGTRELLLYALEDAQGKAGMELENSRIWMQQGDAKLMELRPRLASGACDATLRVALNDAIRLYMKAGTSAVQAGRVAGP